MLARMAATLQPPVRPARSKQQAQLAELINARDGLVRDRTALKNRDKNLTITILKRQCKQRLDQIARHIEVLDAEIARVIAADPNLLGGTKSSPASTAWEHSPPTRSSPPCPNWGPWRTSKRQVLLALPPSLASQDSGRANPLSAAEGPMSARRSTCRLSSPPAYSPSAQLSITPGSLRARRRLP